MKKKETEHKHGGVVVRSQALKKGLMRLSFNSSQTHNIIIGTTGSGKTQSYILPSILSIADSDASMVINDPKGELCQKTSSYLKDKGYHVYVFDYFQPLAGTCFNQLFMVEEEYEKGLPHLYRARAIGSLIKTIAVLASGGEDNRLTFFQVEPFRGTKNSMPQDTQNDLVKGRYLSTTGGYEILLPKISPEFRWKSGFSMKSCEIERLKEALIEIYKEAREKSEKSFRNRRSSGLEALLDDNEYLYYREQKVIDAALEAIGSLSKETITRYYLEELDHARKVADVSDSRSSSFKTANGLLEKYQKILDELECRELCIQDILSFLKRKQKDEEDLWIEHETAAVTFAGSIATMLVGKNDKGDKFWDQTATSMQKALILFVCRESHLPFSKHLGSVNRILANLSTPDSNSGKSPLDSITDRFLPSDIVRLAMSEVRLAPDKTKGSILASASVATEIFGDYAVADQSSRTDFDPKSMVDEKTAVFLVSPGNDDAGTAQYTILSTLFIEEVYSALNRMLSLREDMTLPRPVYFLLDEIANIPPIPELGSKISLARSKNMRFSLVIQSYEQLKQHYKESYDTIRENSNILYILSNNTGTAKEISERIGKTTIEINSISSSTRDKGESVSTSTSTTGRDLFTPQEIMQMKEGTAIYLMQRQQPYLTTLVPVWKWPIHEWLVSNKVPDIHVRRHRQEVNYFCPDPTKFTIAYESLARGIILDRFIYRILSRMKPSLKAESPKTIEAGLTFRDEDGNRCQYIILEDGTKQKISL